MIQQSSMLISGFLELAVFMYYANSVFMPKRSYTKSNFFVILGYIILFMLSLLYIPAVNIGAFVIINFALIYLCFDTTLKTAVIQTCILTAIMMLSEGILSMLTNIGIYQNSLADISLSARIVHAAFSKLLYFVGILIDKYIQIKTRETQSVGW